MKLLSETHDEYKQYLLEQIRSSRQLIRAWCSLEGNYPLVSKFIDHEQKEITKLMGELKRNEQERMANREATKS